MSASRFNEDLTTLAPGDRVSQAVTAARFNSLATLAKEGAMGTHIRGGPGIRIRSGPHGTTITRTREFGRRGGAASALHPFFIRSDGRLYEGTVNFSIPTLEDDPIGDDGNDLSMASDAYVYICAEYTLGFSAFFLSSQTLVGFTIVTSSTPLSDTTFEGNHLFYRYIGRILDGRVVRPQPINANLNFFICDISSGVEGEEAVQAVWEYL